MSDLSLDLTRRNTVAASVAYAMFVYLSFYSTSQISVQRYVSMPSVAVARRSLAMTGIINLGVCLLFFFLGSAIFAFYQQSLPSTAAAGSGFPALDKKDQLLPYFVQTELPLAGFTGLFLTGLFAAGFSSIDGGINCLTACVLCDWFSGKGLPVRISRALSAVCGAGVIGSALIVPQFGETVFDIIVKIAGTCFGPLLGLFLLAALVPRANAAGALFGLVAGLVSIALVIAMTTVSPLWYGAVTCLPTVLVGCIASLCFPAPQVEQLSGLILRISRMPSKSDSAVKRAELS
jgi:Na+/proline symporter